MLELKFDENYDGQGISKGIQRGLLPYLDGKLIVQEGMGIGAFAIQDKNRTYFCSIDKITEENASGKVMVVQYQIDRRLDWMFLNRPSSALTTFLELAASKCYMKAEAFQGPLLKMGTLFRKLFGIRIDFRKIQSLGKITAKYTIKQSDVYIEVDCKSTCKDYKLFVMNEIGGELFSQAVVDGGEASPPTGWQRVEKSGIDDKRSHMLTSASLGVAFYMEELEVPKNIESKLFWGREVSGGYNWAGFESEIKCLENGFSGYSYKICFENHTQGVERCAR
ncbi:MAG: hypothetical protein WBH44_02470 [Proteocatella sp.]